MIRDDHTDQIDLFAPEDFATPFGAGLDPQNRSHDFETGGDATGG